MPQDKEILKRIVDDRIADRLKDGKAPLKMIEKLKTEIAEDYSFSLRKAIGKKLSSWPLLKIHC